MIAAFSVPVVSRGALPAPVNSVLPAITGTAVIGQTLSVSTGTWANSPSAYSYQWKRDNVSIGGATSNTYVIPSTTGGLSCTVTATNASGSTATRASSGVPRQFWICGDSLSSSSDYSDAVQAALDAQFGANAWIVYNVAISGHNVANMETRAQVACDPYVDRGHGVIFFHEYANQVLGVNGSDVGADVASLLFAFTAARVTASGSAPVLYCTSPYRGAQSGSHSGVEAHIASELIRAGYAGHGGSGLVDFDNATLLADINGFDGVHWTSDVYPLCATLTVDAVLAAGLTGGAGDLRMYAPVFTNLKTFTNPAYVYDPINPLPYPVVATHLQVTAGSGWDATTHTISGGSQHVITADGPQTIYNISPAQSTGSLSGGTYILS
jgi:hypothetical protein